MQEINPGGLFAALKQAQKATNNDGRARLVKLSDHKKEPGKGGAKCT